MILLFLTGCSISSKTQIEYIRVPNVLTKQVIAPDISKIQTNGDMFEALIEYKSALQICNGKLSVIEELYGEKVLDKK